MADWISWVATGATCTAALITASSLGARITGYGFIVFLFGSLCWLAVGTMTGQPALLWTNAVLTLLNIFGIWRWLGRQAQMEQGAQSAREASRATPGETYFSASTLMASALIDRNGEDVGKSVDAMIGLSSGRIHYLVASTGGVAGVGEDLRRVDWQQVKPEHGKLRLSISSNQFAKLPLLARDDWPGQ